MAQRAGVGVLSNDYQFLARRSIVAPANVAHSTVANIKTFDNGEAERSGLLNDTTTHNSSTRPMPSEYVAPACGIVLCVSHRTRR
jgi:hypothetical protein